MPSPFPGMDPYLEGPRWSSFHTMLCTEIARHLSPLLGSRYIPLVEERLVLDTFEDVTITARNVRPDVTVVADRVGTQGQAAVLDVPLRMATALEAETPFHFVEIRDVDSMTVVTVIEIFSPANKQGEGRLEYLWKRRALLNSDANLIEIDLLRGGLRPPMREELPPYPYFVLVHRASSRPVAEVWPVGLRSPLPVVPVPLLPPDQDVELDLQAVFSGAYDTIGYGRAINYQRALNPPLEQEDAEWVQEVLSHR